MKRLLLLTTLLAASQARADADMTPELQKTLACMTRALEALPRIDDVKTGMQAVERRARGSEDIEMSVGAQQPDREPYIEYRVHEADGATVLRFTGSRNVKADGSEGLGYSFVIGLSGIAAEGQGPRTYRTLEVTSAWKAQCGVDAGVLFI